MNKIRNILSALNVFSNYKKLKRYQDGEWALRAVANKAIKDLRPLSYGTYVCDRGLVSLAVVPEQGAQTMFGDDVFTEEDYRRQVGPDDPLLYALQKIAACPLSDWGRYPMDYAAEFQRIAKEAVKKYMEETNEQDTDTKEP